MVSSGTLVLLDVDPALAVPRDTLGLFEYLLKFLKMTPSIISKICTVNLKVNTLPNTLTISSTYDDGTNQIMPISRNSPQPRVAQAHVANLLAKLWIILKDGNDTVRVRTSEEVPCCNEPRHLRLQLRLGRMEQVRGGRSRHNVSNHYTRAAGSCQSDQIVQVLVAKSEGDTRYLIRGKPGVYNGLKQLSQDAKRHRHIKRAAWNFGLVNGKSREHLINVGVAFLHPFEQLKYASQICRRHHAADSSCPSFDTRERRCHRRFVDVHENNLVKPISQLWQDDVVQMTCAEDAQTAQAGRYLPENGHHMVAMRCPSHPRISRLPIALSDSVDELQPLGTHL